MKFNELIKLEKYKDYRLEFTFFWLYYGRLHIGPSLTEPPRTVWLPSFSTVDDEYSYYGDIDGWQKYIEDYPLWADEMEDVEEHRLFIDHEAKTIKYELNMDNPEQLEIDEERWEEYKSGVYGEFTEL